MASVIDSLPPAQHRKVIDALLAGKSLRKVALLAGVSHTVVDDYKRRTFLPTLQAAQKINAVKELAQSPEQQIVETTTLTRASLAADPILSRIAHHQKTIDAAIVDASAEKKGRDIAALISTDLKGLELDAKLTGRLDNAGPNIAIQIVCPASELPDEPAGDVIDILPGK
jgi:hypothetical protein